MDSISSAARRPIRYQFSEETRSEIAKRSVEFAEGCVAYQQAVAYADQEGQLEALTLMVETCPILDFVPDLKKLLKQASKAVKAPWWSAWYFRAFLPSRKRMVA